MGRGRKKGKQSGYGTHRSKRSCNFNGIMMDEYKSEQPQRQPQRRRNWQINGGILRDSIYGNISNDNEIDYETDDDGGDSNVSVAGIEERRVPREEVATDVAISEVVAREEIQCHEQHDADWILNHHRCHSSCNEQNNDDDMTIMEVPSLIYLSAAALGPLLIVHNSCRQKKGNNDNDTGDDMKDDSLQEEEEEALQLQTFLSTQLPSFIVSILSCYMTNVCNDLALALLLGVLEKGNGSENGGYGYGRKVLMNEKKGGEQAVTDSSSRCLVWNAPLLTDIGLQQCIQALTVVSDNITINENEDVKISSLDEGYLNQKSHYHNNGKHIPVSWEEEEDDDNDNREKYNSNSSIRLRSMSSATLNRFVLRNVIHPTPYVLRQFFLTSSISRNIVHISFDNSLTSWTGPALLLGDDHDDNGDYDDHDHDHSYSYNENHNSHEIMEEHKKLSSSLSSISKNNNKNRKMTLMDLLPSLQYLDLSNCKWLTADILFSFLQQYNRSRRNRHSRLSQSQNRSDKNLEINIWNCGYHPYNHQSVSFSSSSISSTSILLSSRQLLSKLFSSLPSSLSYTSTLLMSCESASSSSSSSSSSLMSYMDARDIPSLVGCCCINNNGWGDDSGIVKAVDDDDDDDYDYDSTCDKCSVSVISVRRTSSDSGTSICNNG